MRLKDILHQVDTVNSVPPDTAKTLINGITDRSSEAEAGFLFVAVKGFSEDGHDYIQSAIDHGAGAVVGEREDLVLSVPYIQVQNSRKALGLIAKNFYGNPSRHKTVIGVTGTNGKTTTSFLLKHLFESSGMSCALIGTIQHVVNGEVIPSGNTTPNALAIHRLLAKSQDAVVVMEVSSHGIDQYRIEGIEFDCCLFTNLHREHLDYHGTMEEYFLKKAALFRQLKDDGTAVLNTDNCWGERLAADLKQKGKTVVTVGSSTGNDIFLKDFQVKDSRMTVDEQSVKTSVPSPMIGIHNLYNTAMAYATAKQAGVSTQQILDALLTFKGVSGRFEMLKMPNGATAVIDYAHTADALHYCLSTAKSQSPYKLIHVFGFRGDRDPSKRPDMLQVSTKISDCYVLTFDDLNSVSPADMTEALKHLNNSYGNKKGVVIPDRSLAIQHAIEISGEGDWIVITGKGNELYKQQVQLRTVSDKDTVQFIAEKQNNWNTKELN
ncbi:UDP-N-acetylmuramoyl-L-alanyl-D-glutamate--2,6-diaminopimelate ligase [Indiicoccus explosivorum]|uniref:UDP-N-acetylmuramoyl-L-alanyl-D-glutamate--2, 6-diaminopimelate ligase n=1 Tax=Indiicoccus explosivorum TaxID=1917864 RepID=UPI000B436FBC|nr:UDP-N-acetylmuramoyl-L-alanyl-D-glutamate--2,6-diaminopimelate ligase [Indiicoccus explosivorum]